jgi:hypothetical protein
MKLGILGNSAVVLLIAAGLAAPLITRSYVENQSRQGEGTLLRQTRELEQLTAENARLSNDAARAAGASLSNEQMAELLKLRAEAGGLRRETNNLGRLGAANAAKLTPEERAQRAQELSGELLDAARRIVAELPEAVRRFREEQGTVTPLDFPELRSDFPKVNGKRMTGLYTFGFIRAGGPKPGDNLVLQLEGMKRRMER